MEFLNPLFTGPVQNNLQIDNKEHSDEGSIHNIESNAVCESSIVILPIAESSANITESVNQVINNVIGEPVKVTHQKGETSARASEAEVTVGNSNVIKPVNVTRQLTKPPRSAYVRELTCTQDEQVILNNDQANPNSPITNSRYSNSTNPASDVNSFPSNQTEHRVQIELHSQTVSLSPKVDSEILRDQSKNQNLEHVKNSAYFSKRTSVDFDNSSCMDCLTTV